MSLHACLTRIFSLLSTEPNKYHDRVEKVIHDLTPQQVLNLGQELGLYRSTLKKMPQESVHGDMVHAWWMKMDDVPEVGVRGRLPEACLNRGYGE